MKTKFGSARINNCGYYQIDSRIEGNRSKLLYRLIYEDFYNVTILDKVVVHYKDGNKTNNDISNLELMYHNEHNSKHVSGKNNPFYGKKHPEDICLRLSKLQNTTGFYRVIKLGKTQSKTGSQFRYQYYENSKRKCLKSDCLNELKNKVLDNGLPWIIIDEEKAMKTMEE